MNLITKLTVVATLALVMAGCAKYRTGGEYTYASTQTPAAQHTASMVGVHTVQVRDRFCNDNQTTKPLTINAAEYTLLQQVAQGPEGTLHEWPHTSGETGYMRLMRPPQDVTAASVGYTITPVGTSSPLRQDKRVCACVARQVGDGESVGITFCRTGADWRYVNSVAPRRNAS